MTGTVPLPEREKPAYFGDGAPIRPRRPGGPRAGGGYSRFVGLMKVALPIAAGILMLMVVIWPQIEEESEGFRLGISSVLPGGAGGQRIVSARFNGIDSDGRPYTVTADSAVQAEANEDGDAPPVLLESPKADMTLGNGAWIALSADDGAYHKQTETLDLEGNVSGFHDDGYEIRTTRAQIDLGAGAASGSAPVAGHGPLGEIKGEGFRLTDGGKRIVFTGKSQLTIYPPENTDETDRTDAGSAR